jgi:SAM-dependent methyltransferase
MSESVFKSQDQRKQDFLSWINSELPPGVDWKEGARAYCRSMIADHGDQYRTWQLVKPFVDGPDFSPFFQHLYTFLNVLETANLGRVSHALDVACGGGWVAHYLAKLGHRVLGIDICPELLDIARDRLAADPFGAIHGQPLNATFRYHDIEAEPLAEQKQFDFAMIESAMHHLLDPVSALENLARSMKDDGVIAVIEGGAPPKGSEHHRHLAEVMAQYKTLERPYSREQVLELLDLSGFKHRRFFYSVNGLFEETPWPDGAVDGLVRCGPGWNLFLAGQTEDSMRRLRLDVKPGASQDGSVLYQQGFYGPELDEQCREFRWSRPKSHLRVSGDCTIKLEIRSFAPQLYGREQTIHVCLNGMRQAKVLLRPDKTFEIVVLEGLNSSSKIDLYSDTCFYPFLTGGSDDRVLSFMVRVCR